tara:strand:+ start:60 stop:392 length:333 start_codon:yes stop_codon:yes gene_type:complete
VGHAFGNWFDVLRISLGDYASLETALYLSDADNYLYWFMWFSIVLVGCIVFLNFIIAEACHSYEVVAEYLSEYVYKSKAKLIAEAEGMTMKRYKTMKNYPKYIIIREVAN